MHRPPRPARLGVLLTPGDYAIYIFHDNRDGADARLRVFFLAEPAGDTEPKSVPDEHSLSAGWFTIAEMQNLSFRHPEALWVVEHVAEGGVIAPIELFGQEGERFGKGQSVPSS